MSPRTFRIGNLSFMDAGRERGGRTAPQGWPGAIASAAAMVITSVVGFVLIPNWLIGYLSLRVSPKMRDLLVTGWWAFAFVACCALLLGLQRRGWR